MQTRRGVKNTKTEEQMLFNQDEIDEFDNEPQDSSLDNDSSEDEYSREAGPEIIETQNDGDDVSDESTPHDRILDIPDDDELKKVSSPLAPVKQEGALFRNYEQNNQAYTDAMEAYFGEKNYQQAIGKFDEAIEDASQRTARDLTQEQAGDIIAKSMYWQAEAYVKTQNISQAIEIFKVLIQDCQEHYLTLAAQRRAGELNAKNS